LLRQLADSIPQIVAQAMELSDQAIAVGVLSQPLASALHETQYSRLFRS